MKFFSKILITDEQIKMLKESRKVYVRNKVISHNGNFVEFVNMEKGLKVYPKQDDIIDLIKEHLEPRLDDYWLEDYKLHNYKFDRLPSKLKKYMLEKDSLFFSFWLKRVTYTTSTEMYNSREERLSKLIPDYSDDDYIKYVLLGHGIPSTIGRKARESARRSYKTVMSLLKSNVNLFTNFMTFTFALQDNRGKYEEKNNERGEHEYNLEFDYIDAKDFEQTKKAFTDTIRGLSTSLKRKGISFKYIAVWELQKNGNYHFHLLCSEIPHTEQYKIPTWLDYDFRGHKVNDGYGLIRWKYGKSDIQKIKSHEKITTYISKYIIKSFLCVSEHDYQNYLNKKKYFTSSGLKKSVEKYLINDDLVQKEFESLELLDKVAYEKEYINPYNSGRITNKIYTLI
jgi:hypothetical protein